MLNAAHLILSPQTFTATFTPSFTSLCLTFRVLDKLIIIIIIIIINTFYIVPLKVPKVALQDWEQGKGWGRQVSLLIHTINQTIDDI